MKIPSFDGQFRVFNRDRTREATRDYLGSFDQYGLKEEWRTKVWHVATKQRLAIYNGFDLLDVDGNDTDAGGSGFAFSEDGRELIVDGSPRTFPFHPAEANAITRYLVGLRDTLSDAQIARVESIDTTGTGVPIGDATGEVGTYYDELDYFLADVACRRFAPLALDAAGHPDHAERLRTMARIDSENSATAACEALEAPRALFAEGDLEPLTCVLDAAAQAAAETKIDDSAFRNDPSSSAGWWAGYAAAKTHEVVGDGTKTTDEAVEIISELVAFARELPRFGEIHRLIKTTNDIELGGLALVYPSEDVERLIETETQERKEAQERFEKELKEVKRASRERFEREKPGLLRAAKRARDSSAKGSKFNAFQNRVRDIQDGADCRPAPQKTSAAARLLSLLTSIYRSVVPRRQ